MTLAVAADIAGWTFIANFFAFAVVQTAVFKRLEHAHYDAWCAMDKPTLLTMRHSLKSRLAIRALMLGDAHKALGDERLTVLVWTSRVLVALSVVLFVVSAGLTIAAR